MATIDIKMSQDAFNHQPTNSPSVIVDSIERVTYAAAGQYQVPSSWSLNGATLAFRYADGATETYQGFVKTNPAAASGTATATGYEIRLENNVSLHYNGQLNLDYTTAANGMLEVEASEAKGLTVSDVGFDLLLPRTDPQYDTVNGNGGMQAKGAVHFSASGEVSGTISQLIFKSEKMPSSSIDGNFRVAGNLLSDGQQLTHSSVTGTLTGFHQAYADGSHLDVAGLAVQIGSPTTVDLSLLGNAANFGGADSIAIDLPSALDRNYLVASGEGNDTLTIKGGGGRLNVDAGAGNDRISLLGDAHQVNGGAGIDTVVLAGAHGGYQLVRDAAGASWSLRDSAGATSSLSGVERLQFGDTAIALDIDGNAGQAYRLYQAAFNRTPDPGGLSFWIDVLDRGVGLQTVAQGFTQVDEYKKAYGAIQNNRDLVTKFYENILHRAPEEGGLNFWTSVLDEHRAPVSEVLAAISESAENKAGLASVIGNGFEYVPFHG